MSNAALFDANVLTAWRDEEHVKHDSVTSFIVSLRREREIHVAPQSLYEFWVVATRPRPVNGLGWSVEEAVTDIVVLRNSSAVLPDPPGLLDEWLELCRTHRVSGKAAHDARLAAYARLNGIDRFVTLNPRDFARYGLSVVVP